MYRRSRRTSSLRANVTPKQPEHQQQQQPQRPQPVFTVQNHVYDEMSEMDNDINETYQRSNVTPDPDKLKPDRSIVTSQYPDETTDNDTPIYIYRTNSEE